MALSCFVDAFNMTTGIVGTTIARTGYGFQPKACLYWWSGSIATTTAALARRTLQWGMGFATSATNRCAATFRCQDAIGTMVTGSYATTANCMAFMASNSALEGSFDLQSFDSNGQTLVITDSVVSQLIRIHCLALGGSDLTDATVVQFQHPGTTGTQDVTVGFEPSAVLLLCAEGITATLPAFQTAGAYWSLGGASSASAVGCTSFQDANAQPSSIASEYARGTECLAMNNGLIDEMASRAQFSAFLSTGFRLNWQDVFSNTGHRMFALALKGCSAFVGNFLTATTLTTIPESGFGFQPRGGLMFSHCAAQNTADVSPRAHARLAVGGFTSPSNRACQVVVSQDAANSAICSSAVHEAACLQLVSSGTVSEALVDIQSIDSDGFTAVMDDADTSPRYVTYMVFGDGAAVPAGKAPPPLRRPWRYYGRAT